MRTQSFSITGDAVTISTRVDPGGGPDSRTQSLMIENPVVDPKP